MILLILLVLGSSSASACAALKFQYEPNTANTSTPNNDIKVVSQSWYTSANAYFNGSVIWLTAFSNTSLNGATQGDGTNLGRVVYKDPIQFTDSTASFTTAFTFQIITTRPFPDCGSGMAFFIADSLQAPLDSDNNGALGLQVDPTLAVPPSPAIFFAVEFDTHVSPLFNDPSASHIGIDINSVRSLNTTDTSPSSSSAFYPQLFLYNNSTFTAWIEYNSSTHLIQVWMTNHSVSNSSGASSTQLNISAIDRPQHPCLQIQYDLSTVFSEKFMYMGFSATSAPNDQGMEGHAVYSWSFSNELVTPISTVSRRKFKLYLAILPSIAGALVLIIMMAWAVMLMHRRNRRKRASAGRIENALQTARPFSYKELRKATNGFDEKTKVGEGGYGSVYKGTLSDGSVVAVKKLRQSLTLEEQFFAEASIIRKVRHRYLLELQGWCYEQGQEALLVSPYMSKGSLDSYLFDVSKKKLLGKSVRAQTETRIRILTQVAAALEYLHGGLGERVLHRDVKAANVLLTDDHDKQVEARLCDFGLARLIGHEEGAVAMTAAGTPGYVAPELLYSGMATDKADAFSFGVLTLEVACGRRAISKDHTQHIYDWLWSTLGSIDQSAGISDEQLHRALDPMLVLELDDVEAVSLLREWRCVLHVGMVCCLPAAECRPSMKEVTRAFDTKALFPLPKVKPCSPFDDIVSSSTGTSALATSSASGNSSLAASLLSAPR